MEPLIVAYGYLSIDTITVSGRQHEGVPGGAALYQALGARAAGARVALAAAVGDDYPDAWLAAFSDLGIDTRAVERRPGPTRRARIAHAADGGRHSRHFDEATWWERTAALAPVPLASRAAPDEPDLATLGPMPLAAARAIAARHPGKVVLDLSEAFASSESEGWLALGPLLRCFAPSREETRLLMPGLADDEALDALAARGIDTVQKRGAEGLSAAGRDLGLTDIPAEPVVVIDPTGAGDATVGALAARLAAGDDLLAAARTASRTGARAVTGIGPTALGFPIRLVDQPQMSAAWPISN
jgi:sugar/nucleoside kinase (ribokinase family)